MRYTPPKPARQRAYFTRGGSGSFSSLGCFSFLSFSFFSGSAGFSNTTDWTYTFTSTTRKPVIVSMAFLIAFCRFWQTS